MRRLPVAVLAAVMGSSAAGAADIATTSKIAAVTVFPTGAEVMRTAKVRIPAGEHTVVLNHLPALAAAGSIRVEGRSTGRLEIGAVDTRRVLIPHADPEAQATERRRIELEIERLRDAAARIDAEVKAADAQKALIAKLTELPAHPAPPGPQGTAAQPDWGQLLSLVGTKLAEVERAQLEARIKLREVERQVRDLEKKLASLAPGQLQRTEVKVSVAAAADVEAELDIRYQVGNASWQPSYDARLATGSKSAPPKLSLVRRASIQQRTGEDWTDVALELSTTRPGTGTAAPELHPVTVDYEPDMPPPRPIPRAATRAMKPKIAHDAEGGAPEAAMPAAPMMAEAQQREATVEAAAFQAIFKVPGRLTVPGTGEQKRVQLDTTDLQPTLVVRTAPRVEPKAYLYAKIAAPKAAPYLPGQIALFRDGTFVGNGRLPQLTPGEEHELGFGADDAVRVRHALLEEKRGETGLISTSKTDVRNWRITIKNAHAQPIQLTVMDQIPVSQQQDIKVELLAKTPLTRRDVEDRRGVLAWDTRLEPDEERVLDIGYRVTWPSGKKIQYGN
jgi:uncharacterized protein (TIGR02231 family)